MGDDNPERALGSAEGALAIVGLLYLSKLAITNAWAILTGLRAHVWSRLWNRNFVQRYGEWAVVTGCTDGIGKEYAKELAKTKMNIVLISRTQSKLEKVAAEISEEFGVKTEIVRADFSNGQPIYQDISKHLQDKEIGILVNNVGVMLPHPMKFGEASEFDVWSHVNINVAATLAMTKLVLPGMVSRRKGAIINIASIAGTHPLPLMGIYGATKAFVDDFSQSLQWEYRSSGITVQTVNPSYVSTNMTSFSDLVHKQSPVVPTATTFVSHAIATIGYTCRTSGYWIHGIAKHAAENYCPKWLFMFSMYMWNLLLLHNLKENKE
ncbi:inactive hydroxysteroid dehydrogenase-like protein 1 [Penaeus indicus]|uniref:inactive hydroxysteroid dehydrogenase-like protein 1 n=1 Tax=Penaeus indicus TaxID=29960 RepID=UPI00300D5766